MAGESATLFDSSTLDDIVVVHFRREMLTDEDNLELLGEDIQNVLSSSGQQQLILDVSELRHVTSAVLGKWIYLHRSIRRDGGRMIVSGAQDSLREIFEATRLNTLFDLAGDLDEAKSMLEAD